MSNKSMKKKVVSKLAITPAQRKARQANMRVAQKARWAKHKKKK